MSFSENIKNQIWLKARVVTGEDSNQWRKDQCEAWIGFNFYGNRDSQYGWEIDHIDPNGSDDISNLRPLQWENNANRQDGKLTCPVTFQGIDNIKRF